MGYQGYQGYGPKADIASLLIQQVMQPVIQRLRKTQLCQLGGHRHGELNSLAHGKNRLVHRQHGGKKFMAAAHG